MPNLKYSMRGLLQHWTNISIILTSKKESVMSPTSWPSASSTTHPFSFMIPSSDQDMDDVALASCSQRHTEDKPITAILNACQSVSRRCLLCSMEQGNLWEKEMSISQLVFGVTRNTYSAHSNFLKTLELRNWSMDQGNLMSRDRWLSRKVAEKSVITNSTQLEPKKNAEFYKKNYGESNWNFVKFINKVISWSSSTKFYREENYENSKVQPSFDTIARRKFIEDQITVVELSGRVQELQNEVNCSNDSQDFSTCGISSQWKVPRYQSTSVFPTSSGTWRDVEAFFRIAAPQRKTAKHVGHTWFFGKRFCKSRCIFISSFISRIESNAIRPSKSCSMYLQRRKVEDQNEIKIRDASLDRQVKIQSSLVEETLQRIMEAAIDTYLLEDKIQDRGLY